MWDGGGSGGEGGCEGSMGCGVLRWGVLRVHDMWGQGSAGV